VDGTTLHTALSLSPLSLSFSLPLPLPLFLYSLLILTSASFISFLPSLPHIPLALPLLSHFALRELLQITNRFFSETKQKTKQKTTLKNIFVFVLVFPTQLTTYLTTTISSSFVMISKSNQVRKKKNTHPFLLFL
jgi:hypothetical protein